MKYEDVRERLGAEFKPEVGMALNNGDVEFTARDHQGRHLSLWIYGQAWSDLPDERASAVDKAIDLLREHGGSWVIRRYRFSLDRLDVVQRSGEETQ